MIHSFIMSVLVALPSWETWAQCAASYASSWCMVHSYFYIHFWCIYGPILLFSRWIF